MFSVCCCWLVVVCGRGGCACVCVCVAVVVVVVVVFLGVCGRGGGVVGEGYGGCSLLGRRMHGRGMDREGRNDHQHGVTFPFLSDRNPLWTHSNLI